MFYVHLEYGYQFKHEVNIKMELLWLLCFLYKYKK